MSIASLGIAGSLAGTALPQRAAESEKAQRETAEQARAAEATQQAENAAGIGQTEFSKESGRSELQLACEAIKAALDDAQRRIEPMMRG